MYCHLSSSFIHWKSEVPPSILGQLVWHFNYCVLNPIGNVSPTLGLLKTYCCFQCHESPNSIFFRGFFIPTNPRNFHLSDKKSFFSSDKAQKPLSRSVDHRISDARFRIIQLLTRIGIGIKHLENSWNQNRNQNQRSGSESSFQGKAGIGIGIKLSE